HRGCGNHHICDQASVSVNTTEALTSTPPAMPLAGHRLESDETLFGLMNVLLRHRRLVVALPVFATALSFLVAFLLPPTYTATTTFVPDPGSAQSRLPGGLAGLSGLVGLAGQLGLSFGGDASRSPRFYADVVKSREVLEKVLLTPFPSA